MEETMDKRKKLIVSLIAIFILILTLLGITYAYFVTRIKGNSEEKSVQIKTAKLELFYSDGNGLVETSKPIKPGETIDSKTFSVENRGDEAIDAYGVYLENVINEFERNEDLTLDLTCKEYNTKTNTLIGDCTGLTDSVFPKLNGMIVENRIGPNVKQEYVLTVKYAEKELNQSVDMNKRLIAKVQIYDTRDVVDLSGSITGFTDGDYVELVGTETKTSTIVNNTYKFVGIKPGSYTLNVKNITDGTGTTKGTKTILIKRAANENINGENIEITESTNHINVNINSIETNLNTDITLN